MQTKKKHKPLASLTQTAQASLEYLLTYGWALILIATIVGIIVLITATPGGYACSGTGDLICRALGAEGEDLILTFQNKLPFDIIINPFTGIAFDGRTGYASISYRGKEYRFEEATIAKGDTFTITGIGLGAASTITITYTETATGFEKTWTGNISTPQEEICNDGIANTPSGEVDVLNPECEETTYLFTPPAPGAGEEFFNINSDQGTGINLNPITGDPYNGKVKVISAEFSFYIIDIIGDPPLRANIGHQEYADIARWNWQDAEMLEDLKEGWNYLPLVPEETKDSLPGYTLFSFEGQEESYTIAWGSSPNAPKLTVKVKSS